MHPGSTGHQVHNYPRVISLINREQFDHVSSRRPPSTAQTHLEATLTATTNRQPLVHRLRKILGHVGQLWVWWEQGEDVLGEIEQVNFVMGHGLLNNWQQSTSSDLSHQMRKTSRKTRMESWKQLQRETDLNWLDCLESIIHLHHSGDQ